jgi:hypothetical protein
VVTSHFVAPLLTQVDTEAESDFRYRSGTGNSRLRLRIIIFEQLPISHRGPANYFQVRSILFCIHFTAKNDCFCVIFGPNIFRIVSLFLTELPNIIKFSHLVNENYFWCEFIVPLRYSDSEPGIAVPMPVRRTSPQPMTGTVEVSGTHKFAPSDAVHWSHLRARPHADPVSARTRKD